MKSPKKVGNITPKSGITKTQLELLKIFAKEPWRSFTIAELRNILRSKSHHLIDDAVSVLKRKGIIREEIKGKTRVFAVDYENEAIAQYFAAAESAIKEGRTDIPFKILKKITDGIKNPFYALLVGGSYAKGTQKPASDIDIAIIIPDCGDKKAFEAALNRGELIIPEVHGFAFTSEEFYQMLVNNEYNYGKEIARKHVIVYGAEPYYKILFEAIKHGFKG